MRIRNTAEGPAHISRVESLGPLFDSVPKDMVRHPDHATSVDAARALVPHLSELQQRVLDAFRLHGGMTDETLERLSQFAGYSPSTIRKRRSELTAQGLIVGHGTALNNANTAAMTVWELASLVSR